MPAGIKGIGLQGELPIPQRGGALGLSPFLFDLTQSTFVAAMSKRNSAGPFVAGVLAQGVKDGTGLDVLSLSRGSLIAGTGFYSNFDSNVGTFVTWWTAEYSSGGIATGLHYFWYASSTYYFAYDYSNACYELKIGNQTMTVASAVAAGATYNVASSWHIKVTIDGTNYARVSINDTHTFGITTAPTLAAPGATMYIGSNGTAGAASMLLEGSYLIRRVMYDGSYGTNLGNGDELNLIYAAGVGADPCTIMGSWDGEHCVPTNSTVGALVTGTGEAWSHPHSSNLLTDGWLQSYYGGEPWAVAFNGTTSKIDCGSGATLDDLCAGGAIMQVEGWFRSDGQGYRAPIVTKGTFSIPFTTPGWLVMFEPGGTTINFMVSLATTPVTATKSLTQDGKWHHFVAHYNDTTKVAQLAVDGVWGTATAAGVGAYVSDAALSLIIGRDSSGSGYKFLGAIGWINIHNDAHYTPGTNFKPPRTPTAPDVEQWLLNEGTGVTATAQVTAPANNGTITAGTWQPQWYPEGTPIVPTSVQGSATYRAVITSAAEISDLADAAMTADGYFRVPKTGVLQYLCYKGLPGTNGWYLRVSTGGLLVGVVECVTTDATSTSTARVDDDRWHYFKMTFDDAGDRKIDLFVDNVEVTYSVETAGNGAIVTDVGVDGAIGHATTGITGGQGWVRWSNVVRGAGMISRSTPPDPTDANTIGQWNGDEGALAVLTDLSGEGNNGAITGTYSWINTGAMDVDSPGARVYGWGDCRGSDAVNEGEKITFTGLTAGANYVLRALAYSEDGVGIPRVEVYDETNAAAITALTGLATSTEWTPDVLLFSFELPTNARGAAADCTSISIKRISTTAGNVGWHQIELYTNLLDNPSFDTGAVADPWIPYGWSNYNLDAGDSEIETVIRHSEGASLQLNVGAVGEYIYIIPVVVAGKFYGTGAWFYNSAVSSRSQVKPNVFYQSTLATQINLNPNIGAAWTHVTAAGRGMGTGGWHTIWPLSTDPAERYIDDLYLILMDDVTLTVTPASSANSLEGTGIRLDGLDRLTQPILNLKLSKGITRFYYTPRHSAATVALFGNATPVICSLYADANNYILLDWSAANTLRLRYNAGGAGVQTGIYDATGAIVAGTKYLIEIAYAGAAMRVKINGVTVLTITAATIFSIVPTTAYWGSDNSYIQKNDFVISAS